MDKGFSNYEEFMETLHDNEDRFVLILDYPDFQVYKDLSDFRFYYVECGETDADGFFEVEEIAALGYTVEHDLQIDHDKAGAILHQFFDCDVCGEEVWDEHIFYRWFKIVE